MSRRLPFLVALALVLGGSSAQALRMPSAPRCPRLPEVEPVEPAGRPAPGRDELGRDHPVDRRRRERARRLRVRPLGGRADRDPDHRRRQAPGQEKRVSFEYADESDRGPYPIPRNVRIEGGRSSTGDRHAIIVDRDSCRLYELFALYPKGNGWRAGSGAIWNLRSNKLRPAGWTSADAAGLPIFPGLARYDEVKRGVIDHALRFTVQRTRRAYVFPARHYASSSDDASLPPMGLRLRLKASFDVSGYPRQARIVLVALKRYGMLVSDNGSSWYITGAPDPRWSNDQLHTLGGVKGSDFEVVGR